MTTKKNLADFVDLSRKISPLNDKYDFDCHYWEKVGNFTIFGANSRQRNIAELLDESIMSFAKAYVVYGGGTKAGIDNKLKALRAINASCIAQYGTVNIPKLCARDFDKAAEVVRMALAAGSAYQGGRGLNNLRKFLCDKKIITPFTWKSPIKKPADQATGDDADKRRQKKMPDERALIALASIASFELEALSNRDIFTSSTMTLLLSAPSRGSEPLYLLNDCIVTSKILARKALDLGLSVEEVEPLLVEKKLKNKDKEDIDDTVIIDDAGSVLTVDSKANTNKLDWDAEITLLGIKWYSGKSYGHENKWVPTVMYPVVEQAVNRLRYLSEEPRSFAKMLEESSDFPHHRLCPDVPEDRLLTMNEAALALGLDLSIYTDKKQKTSSRNAFLRRKGIECKNYIVSLRYLNKIVRNALPEGFPYISFNKGEGRVKVKWSESLYTAFSNTYSTQKPMIYTELSIPTINTLNEDLAPTKKINRSTGEISNTLSIFERWNFGDLSITSHQIRHLLDTMAAVNGMDGDMRAKWAMRSDPKHNRYYDHTTPEEYGSDFIEDRENEIAARELAYPSEKANTQIQIQVATPRTIQELNTRASLTAHTTEFGMCITSYMSESCTKYRDCINCNEHVCVKGDDGKCERIRIRLKNENKLLKMDKKALDEGVQGALQWYERRKLTTERCSQLLDMLEDPSIEDGSLIKIANVEEISQLDRAMDANGKKRLPKIENYTRLNALAEVSVDDILGIEGKLTADNIDIFDDLDSLEYLAEFDDFFER
ncbi:integrase [Photobacterium phosphoreum]|uniref:integrase n=1 Tax=Photobacterium phosphoreum TaxID=659 RepID=UPI000A432834|nr:integrase [Photobacterium phosphoreum]